MNGRLEEVGFSQFALADAAPSPEGVALVLSARGRIMKVACHRSSDAPAVALSSGLSCHDDDDDDVRIRR